jgi:hypothetical protein
MTKVAPLVAYQSRLPIEPRISQGPFYTDRVHRLCRGAIASQPGKRAEKGIVMPTWEEHPGDDDQTRYYKRECNRIEHEMNVAKMEREAERGLPINTSSKVSVFGWAIAGAILAVYFGIQADLASSAIAGGIAGAILGGLLRIVQVIFSHPVVHWIIGIGLIAFFLL